jgi:hypothetical protein
VPPIEGRPLLGKMKHDASNTLDEWTKKQRGTPRALQVGYRKHKQQPFSEMSHTHRDFFGFIPPPSLKRTQASTNKKCYNCVERSSPRLYPLALDCLRSPTIVKSSRTTLEDESTMKPRRYSKTNVVFGWKLVTLREMYSEDNMP